jgi:hypothetical protein
MANSISVAVGDSETIRCGTGVVVVVGDAVVGAAAAVVDGLAPGESSPHAAASRARPAIAPIHLAIGGSSIKLEDK